MTVDRDDDWVGDEDVEAPIEAPAVGPQRSSLKVEATHAGQRLDAFLAAVIGGVSRSRIRRAIDDGLANINGRAERASYRVLAGDCIEVEIPAAVEAPQPEPI